MRNLDKSIAINIFGWEMRRRLSRDGVHSWLTEIWFDTDGIEIEGPLPSFSTSVADAMRIWNKFDQQNAILSHGNIHEGKRQTWVRIGVIESPTGDGGDRPVFYTGVAKTFPRAMCVAAMRAVYHNNELDVKWD